MENFEKLVAKALDQLPSAVGEKMENVSVCVEQRPTKEQQNQLGMRRGELLLGLYEGVPQTEWGRGDRRKSTRQNHHISRTHKAFGPHKRRTCGAYTRHGETRDKAPLWLYRRRP